VKIPRIVSIILLLSVVTLESAPTAMAWPEPAYSEIFANATRIMPGPLKQLLEDMEQSLHASCSQIPIGEAVERAVEEFGDPNGNLNGAIAAMREAGCAIAAMNDPELDPLVESQQQNFAVVFYGWHPLIQQGNFSEYLRIRNEERTQLLSRFDLSPQLPNLSENIEMSPEFGMAAIAFSHAVTDVANVWLYVWTRVKGALG
jgi:hypothetical protein